MRNKVLGLSVCMAVLFSLALTVSSRAAKESMTFRERWAEAVVWNGESSEVAAKGTFTASATFLLGTFDPATLQGTSPIAIDCGTWNFQGTLSQAIAFDPTKKKARFVFAGIDGKGKTVKWLSLAVSWNKKTITVRAAGKTPVFMTSPFASGFDGLPTQKISVNKMGSFRLGDFQKSLDFPFLGKVTTKDKKGKDAVLHSISTVAIGAKGIVSDVAGPDPAEDEADSPGVFSFSGLSETSFNALSSTLVLNLSGASFPSTTSDFRVVINGGVTSVPGIQVSPSVLSIPLSFLEGLNEISVTGPDSTGKLLSFGPIKVWAGANQLRVDVRDGSNSAVNGATVTAKLSDNEKVLASGVSSGGSVLFSNIPARTILISAKTSNNAFGTGAVVGSSGSTIVVVKGFQSPSTVDNDDFSAGTSGWVTAGAPVTLIPHVEGSPAEATAPMATAAAAADQDLMLGTSGEGPRSISRTFVVKPGVKTVTIRYKFVTSEFPGGYFGSKFNDFFSVALRTLTGGGGKAENNSMNGLGQSAFDAAGSTIWREVTLPVAIAGDVIQADITVANVADGAFDSQVIIDGIKQQKLAIASATLNDIDDSALRFVSADNHTYFSGNTRIHGKISITGESTDSLSELELQVFQNGGSVAIGKLATAVKASLLKSFGAAEKVEITGSQLLFEIPASELANVDTSSDGSVSLKIVARSSAGEEASFDAGSYPILCRYEPGNRYGGRDPLEGGDDWVKPSVRTVAEHFTQITIGDFSNMNGGKFPPHAEHQIGVDLDGWFTGYNERNAATAATMISLLNDATYGSRIITVYVTFAKTPTDKFWNAIKDVTLDDGRAAKDVIAPCGGHGTHFHWNISTN